MKDKILLLSRLGLHHEHLSVDSPPSSQDSATDSVSNEPPEPMGNFDDMYSIENDSDNEETDANLEQFEPPTKRIRTELDSSFGSSNHSETEVAEQTEELNSETGERASEGRDLEKVEVSLREYKNINICPECNERVAQNNIKRHINEKHNKQRISCSVCEKTFVRKQDLIKHICQK